MTGTRPTPTAADAELVAELREAVEQEITAWAFANDIDGALRNDLMRRVAARLLALATPAPVRAAALEEAAKAADEESENREDGSSPWDNGSGSCAWASACNRIAERIRALAAGEEE